MDWLKLMIIAGAGMTEIFLILKYRALNNKAKKLKGTGKMTDIEITNNRRYFVRFLLASFPFLVIWFFTSF
jgi:hypothetical protein